MAKEVASESGIETTEALLADYSITPQVAATPQTPAPLTDRIMHEPQNIMALVHTETPLKGDINTPLTQTDFSGALPQTLAVPDDEKEEDIQESATLPIEDQADIDARRVEAEKELQRKAMLLRTQVIQRDLRRPFEVNSSVLRPTNEGSTIFRRPRS